MTKETLKPAKGDKSRVRFLSEVFNNYYAEIKLLQ